MQTIPVQLTDDEYLSISISVVDVNDWVKNIISEKARVTLENLKSSKGWAAAQEAAINASVGISDDWAVLKVGNEAGVIETALQRKVKFDLELSTGVVLPEIKVSPEAVDQDLISKKIETINSLGGDGVTVSNVIELNAKLVQLQQLSTLLTRRESKGTITPEETARLDKIEAGYLDLVKLDEAAGRIKTLVLSNSITTLEEISSSVEWVK